MANPDDTTLPGEDFIDTLAPAPPVSPAPQRRLPSDAPDRLVFFFSGFDPKSASFYHRLFRTGIAQRNAARDETLALGKRHRIGRWATVWTVLWRGASSALGGRPVSMRTRVHFMRWDDIVRRHWHRSAGELARDYWNVYGRGLASGVLWRIRRASPSAFRLATLPLRLAALSLLLGLAAVAGPLVALAHAGMGVALALGLVAAMLGWRLALDRLEGEWLLRLCGFAREQGLGEVPGLDARLDEMAQRLIEVVDARMRHPGAAPLQEVLVLGYSSGSIMAASVLARAIPRLPALLGGRRATRSTALSLVTLGQCLPIAAEWPGARRLRDELALLADSPGLTWHDFSFAGDPTAFVKSPPWPVPARMKAQVTTSPPEGWRRAAAGGESAGRDIHAHYLRASDRRDPPGAYDFLERVCGPQTLAEAHAVGVEAGSRERAAA